jgi:hypothetical protein
MLFELLEDDAGEVMGRGSTISRELQEKLAKLAAGRCNNEERREMIHLLEQQPDLIPALVNEIKSLREPDK